MNSKFLVNFFLFCLVISSFMPVRGMEEEILPKNPENAPLLKQKIKEFFQEVQRDVFYDTYHFSKCLHKHILFSHKEEDTKESEEKLYANLCQYYDEEAEDGRPVIINLIARGYLEEIKMGLLAGANPNVKTCYYGNPPLFNACSCRDDKEKLVKLLLDAGANPNYIEKYDGDTSLHRACVKGRFNIVRLLLKAGADFTIKDKNGETALDIARDGDRKAIVALLENKSRFECSENGRLLEKIIKQYVSKDLPRVTEFVTSIASSKFDFSRGVVSKEKQIFELLYYVKNTYEAAKVLNESILNGRRWEVELLLLAGVDPNFKSILYCDLDKPLFIATLIASNTEILKLLLKFGANPNESNPQKNSSPLRNLVMLNDTKHAKILLAAGACAHDGVTGLSLLELAKELKYPKMINLLFRYLLKEITNSSTTDIEDYELVLDFEDNHQETIYGGQIEVVAPDEESDDDAVSVVLQRLQSLHITDDEPEKESLFSQILTKCRYNEEFKKIVLLKKIKNYLNQRAKQKDTGSFKVDDVVCSINAVFFKEKDVQTIYRKLVERCNNFNMTVFERNGDEWVPNLICVIRCNDYLLVELLLLAGADPNSQTLGLENTALHCAVQMQNIQIVKLLLVAGADVKIKNHNSETPYDYAEQLGAQKCLKLLQDWRS